MKRGKIIFILSLFSLTGFFLGCESNANYSGLQSESRSSEISLKGEAITLQLPKIFKRSSRYRIEEDLPQISIDSIWLYEIQQTLHQLEFEDSEIDVFVDTSTNFRLVILCNVAPIPFTNKDASIIRQKIENKNAIMDRENVFISHAVTNLSMNKRRNAVFAHYKTEVKNLRKWTTSYNSIYYVTTNKFSVIAYEFSDKEEDFSDVLKTIR